MASALNNNNTSSVVKKPIGVVVIAVILIISSLQQMTALFSYEWYRHNFSYMPGWLITARYCFSWFQRIVGITAAVGLLNLKDFFRKLTMWLGWFTITTVYWKHPYSGFEKASIDLQGKLSQYGYGSLPLTSHDIILASVVIYCLMDTVFWLCVNFYLSRPKVKLFFHP